MKITIYILAVLTIFSVAFSQIPPYHQITSTKGNIELTVTNNGIIGFNPSLSRGGFIWPRGSNAQYLFGGGYFITRLLNDTTLLLEMTYNPNDANSWFIPGSVYDRDTLREDLASRNRVYSSLDYDIYSGIDLNDDTNPRWPIWVTDDYLGSFYGNYKVEEDERSRANSKVKIVSDEDIVAIYKDTDKDQNINAIRFQELYPIGLESQTRIYTYEIENFKDVIFINWMVKNVSGVELSNLSFSPIFDVDMTKVSNAFIGLDNDIMIHSDDNLYVTFASKVDESEKGETFGYMSFKWVQLPLINENNEVDYTDLSNNELSPKSINQLPNDVTINSDDFINQFNISNETIEEGEQKFYMTTEEFTLAPNQSASFVLQINMTPPNENYPELDEATRNKIEAELEANEIFFKERLTNIEVAEELSPISVFPNPTVDGNISIELGLPIGKEMTIELIDLSGNTLGILYQGMHHTQNYELNIGKRATGTYLLRFTVGDKSYSKKFVVGK